MSVFVLICLALLGSSSKVMAIGMPAGAPGSAGAGGAGAAGGTAAFEVGCPTCATFVPMSIGYPALGNNPYMNGYFGQLGTPYNPNLFKYQLGMFAIDAAFDCALAASPWLSTLKLGNMANDIAHSAILNTKPYKVEGVSDRDSSNYGGYMRDNMASRGGSCQEFEDKDGKLGHWGMAAIEKMKEHPIFANFQISAKDEENFCPGFRFMNAGQKEHFWLWFLATLSHPESTCHPGATGQGPNGTAIGLFQLEPRVCHPYGSADLLDPLNNTYCAVDELAKELECRGTFMIDTKRSRCTTYWGTLRENPYGMADAKAASSFVTELPKWPGCQARQTSSNN